MLDTLRNRQSIQIHIVRPSQQHTVARVQNVENVIYFEQVSDTFVTVMHSGYWVPSVLSKVHLHTSSDESYELRAQSFTPSSSNEIEENKTKINKYELISTAIGFSTILCSSALQTKHENENERRRSYRTATRKKTHENKIDCARDCLKDAAAAAANTDYCPITPSFSISRCSTLNSNLLQHARPCP